MSSYVIRLISPRAALACAAVLALAACERAPKGGGTLPTNCNWARAALERNPQIEVVASDSETGVFTIRDKQSGDVQVVSLHDIAAGPPHSSRRLTPAATPAPPALPESTAVPATSRAEFTRRPRKLKRLPHLCESKPPRRPSPPRRDPATTRSNALADSCASADPASAS